MTVASNLRRVDDPIRAGVEAGAEDRRRSDDEHIRTEGLSKDRGIARGDGGEERRDPAPARVPARDLDQRDATRGSNVRKLREAKERPPSARRGVDLDVAVLDPERATGTERVSELSLEARELAREVLGSRRVDHRARRGLERVDVAAMLAQRIAERGEEGLVTPGLIGAERGDASRRSERVGRKTESRELFREPAPAMGGVHRCVAEESEALGRVGGLEEPELEPRERDLRRIRVDEMERRDLGHRREERRGAAARRDYHRADAARALGTEPLDGAPIDERILAHLREGDGQARGVIDPRGEAAVHRHGKRRPARRTRTRARNAR